MTIGTQRGGLASRLHGFHRALHVAPRGIEHAKAIEADFGHVALLKIGDARGGTREGERVRGQEVLVVAHADDQRAAGTRPDHAMRFAPGDHGNGVGAGELSNRAAHRVEQAAGIQAMHQVRDHLGVGLGLEGVTLRLQFHAQFVVILDDAVMHQRDLAVREDRMGVAGHGCAVRRPARVRDPGFRRQVFFSDPS